MIELKRLKLINWHNFENVTFDCARLTYMIGVNAVGKTTILDAIRYCLTTNRNFNALGNKKSGRTLQGSVHAKQRGENAYRRPGRTVAYIGAEFWDSVKRTNFVIAVRVESEGPMQELHPGDQTWYISEDGITLEKLPFIDPRTGAPSTKEDFKPAVGYTRSPSEARDRICRALGIGRAASPLGKKFNEVFQMGTSMDEIPNFREFLYQYILPQPELDLDALQGDRVELENLHAVLAEAQTRATALEQIVGYGREASAKETDALVNRGAALLARAEADAGEHEVWQGHLDAGRRQMAELNAAYETAKNAEAEARRSYLAAHGAASASGEGRALDAMTGELARKKSALDAASRKVSGLEQTADTVTNLLTVLNRSGFAVEKALWPVSLTEDRLPDLTAALDKLEKPLEEQYFAARQSAADLARGQEEKRAELDAVSGGKWVYPHGDAATKVRDAVNAELKSRGMTPDAKIFCELLSVADESWQDCVEACLQIATALLLLFLEQGMQVALYCNGIDTISGDPCILEAGGGVRQRNVCLQTLARIDTSKPVQSFSELFAARMSDASNALYTCFVSPNAYEDFAALLLQYQEKHPDMKWFYPYSESTPPDPGEALKSLITFISLREESV